jgi:acyl-[acyl-carrier-protein]-phospholipid O-acyltransferase/long-chain-fatty-acid--[acyl-carrier-protein] ligase
VRFVMDETFIANFWVRRFTEIFLTVNIARGNPREAIRLTIEALKEGHVVCLFPEGQITRTGTLIALERGFELIAKRANCPLVPVWVDGSWESIFSYERGPGFRLKPYRLPHPLGIAFGDPLAGENIGLRTLQHALLKSSATALAGRFPDRQTAAAVINAHQLGQTSALTRRQAFHALENDTLVDQLSPVLRSFSEQCESAFERHSALHAPSSIWIGGRALREALRDSDNLTLTFHDFSADSTTPLEIPGVLHLPGLAIDGLIIAVSMPNPPHQDDAPIQLGTKPGTWGKLLPGFHLIADDSGELRVHGPAAPEEGLPLPNGTTLDEEGFLVATAAAS